MPNISKYELELTDIKSLERIKKLFDHHYLIMQILNADSDASIDGGAAVHYKVKIKFEENWI